VKRNLLASLALAVGSLVAFLGLLELLAARAESELPEWLLERNPLSGSGIDVPDPDLFWRYRPNVDMVGSYPVEGLLQAPPSRFKTNAFGLRDRERTREKPPGVFRILSLGESTTFGDKLDATESYSFRLEEILNADPSLGRRVEVWNCGIPSYSTYQSLRWLELDGLGFQPDLVLFYHEINDFLPTHHRTGDGQALGLGRTDRELGAARRRVGPLIALLEKSHFYRWLRIRVLIAASQALAASAPGPAPAAPATRYDEVVKKRFPWRNVPPWIGNPSTWPEALPYMENPNPLCRVPDPDRRALLTELIDTLRDRNIDLVLIHPAYLPSRPHRCVLTELARERGVPVVEMERLLPATGLHKSQLFLDIYHPRPTSTACWRMRSRARCGAQFPHSGSAGWLAPNPMRRTNGGPSFQAPQAGGASQAGPQAGAKSTRKSTPRRSPGAPHPGP
jgi:hypothetical protein